MMMIKPLLASSLCGRLGKVWQVRLFAGINVSDASLGLQARF
jgi:hypothetical protein